MTKSNTTKKPFSICALRAIEGFVGGRRAVAKQLGCTHQTIDRWVKNKKISPNFVVALSKLAEGKFSVEELLGVKD